MLINAGETQFSIQFGSNADFDPAWEKEDMASREAMATTFEAAPGMADE